MPSPLWSKGRYSSCGEVLILIPQMPQKRVCPVTVTCQACWADMFIERGVESAVLGESSYDPILAAAR